MAVSKIGVYNLEIECIVGIFPHERIQKQLLYIDIELQVDYTAAVRDHDISQTIDYDKLSRDFSQWVQDSEFLLIENIAMEGCERILQAHPSIQHCHIIVKKPAAIEKADYAWVSFSAP